MFTYVYHVYLRSRKLSPRLGRYPKSYFDHSSIVFTQVSASWIPHPECLESSFFLLQIIEIPIFSRINPPFLHSLFMTFTAFHGSVRTPEIHTEVSPTSKAPNGVGAPFRARSRLRQQLFMSGMYLSICLPIYKYRQTDRKKENVYGGFLKWGYPNMDGLYWKIPSRNGWIRGTPILGNPHIQSSLR